MAARWLARATFLLVFAAAANLIGFARQESLSMVIVGAVGACLVVAGGYVFLAHRGVLRWLAFAVIVLAPVGVLVIFARHNLIWVAVVSVVLVLLAIASARRALASAAVDPRMPVRDVRPPARAFLIMNPKSGGGKVGKFGLKDKAEALGVQVALLEGPNVVDVADLARRAVANGADLLGVAGGDGTQALVAGIAADALTDGVEQRIDLGTIGDRTFVNNASFGAYADIVESPAYRDDKAGTTLRMLPDLLSGHRGSTLYAHVGGTTITGLQALLVSNNPYGMNDLAGLDRRARLDAGTLGVVAVTVNSALQAIELLGGVHSRGLTALTATEVVVDADVPKIPVGIDGETAMMPTPVRCAIRPKVLRVRVPRNRPGVPRPKTRRRLADALAPRLIPACTSRHRLTRAQLVLAVSPGAGDVT